MPLAEWWATAGGLGAVWGDGAAVCAGGHALALAEAQGNPTAESLSADASVGSLEGKKELPLAQRAPLFAAVTTAGQLRRGERHARSAHPLGGMLAMWLMQLGEVVFGGGLWAVRHAGVCRAGGVCRRADGGAHAGIPGQKIEAFEMKMVALVILLSPALVLLGSALAVVSQAELAGLANGGARRFSEVLYAFFFGGQ